MMTKLILLVILSLASVAVDGQLLGGLLGGGSEPEPQQQPQQQQNAGEDLKHSNFFTNQFYRLKEKYDEYCKKPGAVIPWAKTKELIEKCLTPEMKQLKVEFPQELEKLYPELWEQMIKKCFENKIKNFCKRSQPGVREMSTDQSVDSAMACAYTVTYAKHTDLTELYKQHADKLKQIGEREKKCIESILNAATGMSDNTVLSPEPAPGGSKPAGGDADSFFTNLFYKLKDKYDGYCQKPGATISMPKTKSLIDQCLMPSVEQLKNDHPQELDKIYPDLFDRIMKQCFEGKVKNFCKRAQNGVREQSNDQSIDSAFGCVYTLTFANHNDFKELYKRYAGELKQVGDKEQACIDRHFDTLMTRSDQDVEDLGISDFAPGGGKPGGNADDFFTAQFYKLKEKYDSYCQKPGATISLSHTKSLLDKCMVPTFEKLKNDHPEEMDKIYPDMWNRIIKQCFDGKVKNFCKRAQNGVREQSNDQSIDSAFGCVYTLTFANHNDLKQMYKQHAGELQKNAANQQSCIDTQFDQLMGASGGQDQDAGDLGISEFAPGGAKPLPDKGGAPDDFFNEQFSKMKEKYDAYCQKPGSFISFKKTQTLMDQCIYPNIEQLKNEHPQDMANIYPDMFNRIMSHCFDGKVQNVCKRAKDGQREQSNDQSIDSAFICAYTITYGMHNDLKELYKKHGEELKQVAEKEKSCIDNVFDSLMSKSDKEVEDYGIIGDFAPGSGKPKPSPQMMQRNHNVNRPKGWLGPTWAG